MSDIALLPAGQIRALVDGGLPNDVPRPARQQ